MYVEEDLRADREEAHPLWPLSRRRLNATIS